MPADQEKTPVKVALLLDSMEPPAWAAEVICDLASCDGVRLERIILLPPVAVTDNSGPAFRFYRWLDGMLFHPDGDARARQPLPEVVKHLPVTPAIGFYLAESDAPDVMLSFAGRPPQGLAGSARFGAWYIGHPANPDGWPNPGYAEVLAGEAASTACLWMIRTGQPEPVALMRHTTATFSKSGGVNASNLLWTSGLMIKRKLRDVYLYGEAGLNLYPAGEPAEAAPAFDPRRDGDVLKQFWRLGAGKIKHKLDYRGAYEQFRLGIGKRTQRPSAGDVELFPPAGSSWADPFPFNKDGRTHIFFEEWKEGAKGHICVIEVDADGKAVGSPVTVLDRPYHLSYPQVFEHGGEIYMLPETGQNRTVELYRCRHYPDSWQLCKILLKDINTVDSTLLQQDGKWWMFTNVACQPHDGDETFDELQIFFADDLFGPWTAHPMNPIRSDVRACRSAGRLYQQDGSLMRPAQDGSARYGYAVTLNRVLELTESTYREEEIGKIWPDWKPDLLGIHTLNFCGDLVVYDVLSKQKL